MKKFELKSNHLPLGICTECLKSETLTRGNSNLLISFCRHNRTLGLLELKDGEPSGPWKMLCPVDVSEVGPILEEANGVIEAVLRKAQTQDERILKDMDESKFVKC